MKKPLKSYEMISVGWLVSNGRHMGGRENIGYGILLIVKDTEDKILWSITSDSKQNVTGEAYLPGLFFWQDIWFTIYRLRRSKLTAEFLTGDKTPRNFIFDFNLFFSKYS